MKKYKSSHQLFIKKQYLRNQSSGLSKVINNYVHNYPENKNDLFTLSNKYLKDYSVNTLLVSCQKLNKDNETIHKINTKHNNLFGFEKTTKRIDKDVESEIKK